MENASKALVIAGAILLVIAIIAIAVAFVNKTKGTMGEAGNQVDAMTIKMHNNKFIIYDGHVKGSDVKKCIYDVMANNSKSNIKVNVVVFDNSGNRVIEIDENTGYFESWKVDNEALYKGALGVHGGIVDLVVFGPR